MSSNPVNIFFDYDGYYTSIGNEYQWNTRDARLYVVSFRVASVAEISYAMLRDKIYKKMGLKKCKTKLTFSYMPAVVSSQRQSFVCDDDDVYGYLTTLDAAQRWSVLHVEVAKDVQITPVREQGSRVERRSSCGLNYGEEQEDGDARCGGSAKVNATALTLFVGEAEGEQPQPHVSNDKDCEILGSDGIGEGEKGFNDDGVELAMDVDSRGKGENGFSDDDDGELGMDVGSRGIEEFVDLPNVTEDSQFLDGWEDGMGLQLYQELKSKETVIDLVDRASQRKCFGVTIVNSDKRRYVVKCQEADKGCQWYLRAAKLKSSSFFSVRVYRNKHTCSRSSSSTSSRRKGTPHIVASILSEDYAGQMETPKPKSLIGLVQGKLGVEVSYSTALRGKKLAASALRGNPEDGFKMLHSYLYMLEKVNEGTKISLVLDEDKRFKYLFVALGACIEGFQVMRKVLSVDATFLKTEHGGVLIIATAQDENHHNYPIAFAVVDGEKEASWTWFFTTLKTIIPDNEELVFVSDRNASLIKAISEVYPRSHHGFCIYHLSQNIRTKVSHVHKEEAAAKFREIAQIYTVAEFEQQFAEYKRRYPKVAEYLEESVKEGVAKWAKCYFPGLRYNIYTTNCAESLNSTFISERKYSLLPLLDGIISKISEWFNKRRKIAMSTTETRVLVPYVENVIHERCEIATTLTCIELNAFTLEYSVTGKDGNTYVVDLMKKSCSCRRLDIDKYPCVHAIRATMRYVKSEFRPTDLTDLYGLCSDYYMMTQWGMTYCKTIYMVPKKDLWDVPSDIEELYAYPPLVTVKRGRHQEKRFRSAGERRRKKAVPGRNLASWFESSTAGDE